MLFFTSCCMCAIQSADMKDRLQKRIYLNCYLQNRTTNNSEMSDLPSSQNATKCISLILMPNLMHGNEYQQVLKNYNNHFFFLFFLKQQQSCNPAGVLLDWRRIHAFEAYCRFFLKSMKIFSFHRGRGTSWHRLDCKQPEYTVATSK